MRFLLLGGTGQVGEEFRRLAYPRMLKLSLQVEAPSTWKTRARSRG
jgi:hypothetical protein